jgi:hypothetical protein
MLKIDNKDIHKNDNKNWLHLNPIKTQSEILENK